MSPVKSELQLDGPSEFAEGLGAALDSGACGLWAQGHAQCCLAKASLWFSAPEGQKLVRQPHHHVGLVTKPMACTVCLCGPVGQWQLLRIGGKGAADGPPLGLAPTLLEPFGFHSHRPLTSLASPNVLRGPTVWVLITACPQTIDILAQNWG